MCGIVGIADLRGTGRPDPALVARMADTLAHRGPDGAAVAEAGFADHPCSAFGFRRLSLVDFGAGARAFADESRRVRSICNGEIYNAPELRRDLQARGHRFETRCDTEVIPHLYEAHGVDFVRLLDGMFAFAIFDAGRDRLVLGRDRAGEKPLYYVPGAHEVLFASEIKALLAHPLVGRDLDPRALVRYLVYGWFPAPWTPFASIRKLPAGMLLIADRAGVRLETYWDARRHFTVPRAADAPAGEAARGVRRLLGESVRLRMRSDATVGVLLSGGLDSASIAALAAAHAGRRVPTFTLGFDDGDFDETSAARAVAAHVGTEHHEARAGDADLLDALEATALLLDEPLADPSLLPTWLLSRFARGTVKAVLGGEGGDELFGGYPTYLGHRLAAWYGRLPAPARALLRRGAEAIPPRFGNHGIESLAKKFTAGAALPRAARHQAWFGCFPPDTLSDLLAPELRAALPGPPGADDPLDALRLAGMRRHDPPARSDAPHEDALSDLLLADFVLYLQDDLLTKVDRTSMAVSLEVRAPFLHHPLVEYAAALPASLKLRYGRSKGVLREAMRDRLPASTLRRRKRGFSMPLSRLLAGAFAPLVHETLGPAAVRRAGLVRPEAVRTLLAEHLDRRRDHGRLIFNLLMLHLWRGRSGRAAAA